MNKLLFGFALLALVLLPKSVSAQGINPFTYINGAVYNNNQPVAGASVTITCNHNGTNNSATVTTGTNGHYEQTFTIDKCTLNDPLTVTGSKDGKQGQNTGTVSGNATFVYIGLVNVFFSVPEFGSATAGVAVMGAVGAFMLMKKRNEAQVRE